MSRQGPPQQSIGANFSQGFQAALACHRRGLVGDAERRYRALLAADPNHFDSLHNLAVIRAQLGAGDEAMALIQRALRENPNAPDAHNTLGLVLRGMKRHEEAIASHRKALALRSNFASARNNLGVALYELGRHDEAVAAFERALAIDPGYAEAHNNLGLALHALNRSSEAIAHYEKAIAIKPDYAEAHASLGGALSEVGRLAEARHAYDKAIKLSPKTARFYHHLAPSKRFVVGDPHFVAMESLARDVDSLSAEEQIHLHFALGKAYADINDPEASLGHLFKANALKRQRVIYEEAKELAELDYIRAVFTAELIRSKRELGALSSLPVFIVGMPRSGTTLVEQVLASHPNVFGAGELDYFGIAASSLSASLGAPFPEVARAAARVELEQLGRDYLDRVTAMAPAAERITDKLPRNFRFVGLIHLALPNARIIHTRRHPVDTCLSCFSWFFRGDQPFTYDLGELGRYYRAYEGLMRHWREILPPGIMLEVQYEDVVADLEGQARRIVAHCGLEWDDRCLEFYKTERPVRTASAAQVRQPIYSTAVGRWRAYEHLLGPLLEGLAESK